MRAVNLFKVASVLCATLLAPAAPAKTTLGRGGLGFESDHEIIYDHVTSDKQCLLCHVPQRRELLVMLDGTQIPQAESPKLCGQCHGLIFKEWSESFHGKIMNKGREGEEKFRCGKCHEAHSPKFKPMKADPPPHRPKEHHGN